MAIDVSVLMAVYKEPLKVIKKSIDSTNESVKGLSYQFIIVVDNPDVSSDVREYLEQLPRQFLIIWNSENIGLAESLNKAIPLSKGKYCMRMDADDECCLVRAKKQFQYLENRANVDLVGGAIERIDDKGASRGVSVPNHHVPSFSKMHPIFFSTPCFHPTWMIKSEVLKKFKYSSLEVSQDLELLFRLLSSGCVIHNLSDICVKYKISESTVSSKKAWLQLSTRRSLNALYKTKKSFSQDEFKKEIDLQLLSDDKEFFEVFNDLFVKFLMDRNYLGLLRIMIVSPAHRYRMKLIFFAKLCRFLCVK